MYHTARAVISQIIGGIVATITLYVIVINHFSSSHTICHRQTVHALKWPARLCAACFYSGFLKYCFWKIPVFLVMKSHWVWMEHNFPLNSPLLTSCQLPLTQFFLVFWRLWVQVQHRLFFTMMWGFSLYVLYITHRHTFQKTTSHYHGELQQSALWYSLVFLQ